MKQESRRSGARAPFDYADSSFFTLERALGELTSKQAPLAERAEYIKRVFVERNRAIRNGDYKRLDPASIEAAYLLPRKDLHRFVVENWVKHIFLAGLPSKVAESVFMFGLGRLFSAYNDLGAQHSSDVDLNVITARGVSISDLAALKEGMARLRADVLEHFGIVVELHPDFSILGEQAVLARLEHPDERIRLGHCLFYKSNERSVRILRDHPDIREKVFSRVRGLPDAFLFEHFLGFSSGAKATFAKIRAGEPLTVGLDGSGETGQARTVIGSRIFGQYCRRLFPPRLLISPPEWHFSMKYFVNRVYDYVCAMRNLGYPLSSLGFDSKGAADGSDPDFLYLRNAHKLMLHLQELSVNLLVAYGTALDTGYMSRARFLRLVEVDGDKFRADFGSMIISGELIPPSFAQRYKVLEGKIKAKARDRFMEGPLEDLKAFPPGFRYESTHKDKNGYRINVPYSWADLGFFAFSSIAERMARIVEEKLMPALPALGMPPETMGRYAGEKAEAGRKKG